MITCTDFEDALRVQAVEHLHNIKCKLTDWTLIIILINEAVNLDFVFKDDRCLPNILHGEAMLDMTT